MTLREEHSESDRRAWRSRLERERQDLSASVEAALVDDGMLEPSWEDESDEQDRPTSTTGGTALVPPRLSLQSRALPAVRPGSFVETATNAHRAITVQEEETPAQNTGMLARLAQRFTSSLAALGGSAKSKATHQLSTQELVPTQDTDSYLTSTSHRSNRITEQPDVPLVRVIDTIPPTSTVVDATPGKPRSLKRNGKVRLETAEMPVIQTPAKIEEQETGASMLSSDIREALDKHQAAIVADEHQENRTDVKNLPALEMFNGQLGSAARGTLSGSGVFDSGQSDVTISNARITSASVVLVTLTTNPGPVVVQYISLQAQVGFTVHLTAPVTSRTAFNYVVLLGELF